MNKDQFYAKIINKYGEKEILFIPELPSNSPYYVYLKHLFDFYDACFNKQMIYNKEKQLSNKNSNYYNLGMKNQNKKEIILRHFYSIAFEEIKGIKPNKKNKNNVELELSTKEKDNNIEIEFEFHSLEDTKTFKSLIKKIKNL